MLSLKGKTAVVTGGARGIGRAICLTLAKEGADIVINYVKSDSAASELKKEIESIGRNAFIFKADVKNKDEADALIKYSIESLGKIDILVNNAGLTRDNLIMRMSEEDWDTVLDTNLKGAFNCIKSASRSMMKARIGAIINITSVVGIIGNAGQANYASSKAGLIGLTKSVARELAGRGITCNAVAPGFIESDMTDSLPESIKEEYFSKIPLGRFGKAEDVANAVAFLSDENAKYITGQVINVDGGLVM